MDETQRKPAHPVNRLLVERWSPRAFDASPLARDTLLTLIEAARWAPSAFNAQPWRFYYGLRGEAGFARLLDLLIPANQRWAQNASALLVLASDSVRAGSDGPKPSPTHAFDAGAAWGFFAVQATSMGLHAHAMAGFDHARAKSELGMPQTVEPQAAIAVGRLAPAATLPEDLQAREIPSDRRPLGEIAIEV